MSKKSVLRANRFLEGLAIASARIDRAFDPLRTQPDLHQLLVGQGDYQYAIDPDWGTPQDPGRFPVKDCHEMVCSADQRLFMLTNQPANNMLIFNAGGQIIDSWTLGFSSAHGLTLNSENGTEYLYLTDYTTETVVKTTLTGEVVLTLPTPRELGIYDDPDRYLPTQTAIAANGDIYVADGYGSSYVIQFDQSGQYIRHFGGAGKEPANLNCAHGIAIDTRTESATLLVSSREDACFKRFSLEGEYLSTIEVPGAYMGRPVIHQQNLYAAACWSDKLYAPNSGCIVILDQCDQLVSAPGAELPGPDAGGKVKQRQRVFRHCHDVCLDAADNLYVCQWNAGGLYPMKLARV